MAMTKQERKELEALRAENARLKAQKATGGIMTVKIGEKGATKDDPEGGEGIFNLRVYGFGKRPFTFYANQAIRLFSPEGVKMVRDLIEASIEGDEQELTWKDGDEPSIEDLPWKKRKQAKDS